MKYFYSLLITLLMMSSASAFAQTKEAKKKTELNEKSIYHLDATWVSQNKKKMKLDAFRGKPLVLALIYASCPHVCPMTVADIQKIRKGLPEEIKKEVNFLLVTIDPKKDTPKALKKFAEERSITDWTLLNGGADAVLELAMMLGVKYKKFESGGYSHSNIISIVDAQGVVIHQQIGLNKDPALSIETLKKLK